MKPVEIEILMRDGLTPGLKKAGQSVRDLASDAKAAYEEVKTSMQAQKQHVASLEKEVVRLEKAFKNAAPGTEWFEARSRLESVKAELVEERDALEGLIARERELGEAAAAGHDEAAGAAQGHDTILVKLLGGQEKYKTIMEGMPGPLRAAASGINGMTGAARAFIATPLGAIIAAIVLALQALSAWFSSSAEGQMEFARISGYLGGILGQLNEVVMAVGRAIYKAFTDPKQAVSDLWEAIKGNIVNRLEGVAGIVTNFGKGLWNALNLDFDAAGESFRQMGSDILKAASGVDDIAGKARDLALNAHEAAKATADIKAGEVQLHRDRRQWGVERERMETRISDLRLKAQRGDAAANREAERLIREKYNREMSYQQRELDLIRQKNALTTNTDEDYDREAEAQRKLIALEKERNQELSFFNRKDFTLGNRSETVAQRQRNIQTKLGQELAELQRRNDAGAIEAMEEGTAKKLRQIENDYARRKNEIAKQEASWRKDNKAAGRGEALDTEQRAALDEASELNERLRQKAVGEVYQAEFDAMRDNIRQYGDYQQQKLAIASEYAEKIRKTSTEGERRSLERERDSTLASVTTAELKSNIDWQVVFGEFGGMFRDVITPVLADAKAYMDTDEFRNADHDSQRTLIEAVRQMETSAGVASPVSFGQLGADIDAYKLSMDSLREAQEKYRDDYSLLMRAQGEYKSAMQQGTPLQQAAAKAAFDAAKANAEASAENVRTMKEGAAEAKSTVITTATTLKSGMEGVLGGLQKMSSGSASGTFEGMKELGKSASKLSGDLGKSFGKFADKLENVPVVGWIAGLLDVFKDGLSDFMTGLIDAVIGAVGNILSDVMSGDFVIQTGKSLISGVGKIFDTLTFGGFSSWFGDKGNSAEVNASIDRLTEKNTELQASIEGLTAEIKAGRGMKSVDAYEKAYRQQQRVNSNYLEMAMQQAGYHSANHSWAATHRKFSYDEIRDISELIGRSFNGDIFSLSPEEMRKFRDKMPNLWRDFFYSGDSDNYADRVLEKLNDYMAQAGKLGELSDSLREAMTGMTFDSMYSDFVNKLSDMEFAAEGAAENVSGMFYKAMLSNRMGELYYDRLQEWYRKWGDSMKDGMTEGEMSQLRDEYRQIVEDAVRERDAIAAVTGYDQVAAGSGTSQGGAKAGGFMTMTQAQGTRLDGMFTSGLRHWSNMDAGIEDVASRMATAEGHLAKIEDNTSRSAKELEAVREILERLERDGIKV